ncbi:hypothetical protein PO909_018987 [Leuciscus waleckii]
MLLRFPPVAMETAHYREAGMCCRGAGCHGDRYGDLHKWSERALNPHDKFSASRSRSDGIKTMSVGAADEDIRVPPTFPSAKVGIVSLAIKRWLTVVEQMPGGPKSILVVNIIQFWLQCVPELMDRNSSSQIPGSFTAGLSDINNRSTANVPRIF